MTKQNNALRLAGLLELAPEDGVEPQTTEDAAAELRRLHAINAELVEALKKCQFALEPYDDIKPRDWKTDRERLAVAHQVAIDALAKAEGREA